MEGEDLIGATVEIVEEIHGHEYSMSEYVTITDYSSYEGTYGEPYYSAENSYGERWHITIEEFEVVTTRERKTKALKSKPMKKGFAIWISKLPA